jgi:hypothetical protein
VSGRCYRFHIGSSHTDSCLIRSLTYNWEIRIIDLLRASSIGEEPWDEVGDGGGIQSEVAGATKIADLDFSFIRDDKLRDEVVEDLEKCENDEKGEKFQECVLDVVRDEEDLKYNEKEMIVKLISASGIGDERRYLRGSKLN